MNVKIAGSTFLGGWILMISKPFVFENDVANLWGQHGDGNSSWFTTMGNGYQTYTHDIMIFHYSIYTASYSREDLQQTVNQHFWWKHERCEWMTSNSGTMSRHEIRSWTPDFIKCYQLQEVDMSWLILSSWPKGYWIAWRFERAPCWPSWPPRVWNSLTPFGWPRNSLLKMGWDMASDNLGPGTTHFISDITNIHKLSDLSTFGEMKQRLNRSEPRILGQVS